MQYEIFVEASNYCFSTVVSQQCTKPMQGQFSYQLCCCHHQGAGWGPTLGYSCQHCPSLDSAEYLALCEQVSPVTPTSLCKQLDPNICQNGRCVDTNLSYRCVCNTGYILNSQNKCVDDNECTQLDVCANGVCTNAEGSFTCVCNDGYALTSNGRTCTDMNECMESGMCPNGECQNMAGAYKCLCNDGYRQSANQQICYDIDECRESGNSICANGKCENSPGSYKCTCNPGYELSPDGTFCIDSNECYQASKCQNGQCFNMDGTYRCACNPGYRLTGDEKTCVDIDECLDSSEPLCELGECINTIGSFRCSCANGFVLHADGTRCQEIRRDLCFKTILSDNTCTDPSSKSVLRSQCCCSYIIDSVTAVATAQLCWGRSHSLCPARGTADYQKLCYYNTGVDSNGEDINECLLFPNLCSNGICQNLQRTGYRCICDRGYRHPPGKESLCVDIDECESGNKCSNGVCKNIAGSFTCICPTGYQLNPLTSHCEDINECEHHPCINGECRNSIGGFECVCLPYHSLLMNSTHGLCINNRKYTCWSKYSDAGCEGNLLPYGITRDECCSTIGVAWGSPCQSCSDYTPYCPKGYHLNSGTRCIDIDECQAFTDICVNGRCVNTEGSFSCQCKEGLQLVGSRCVDLRQQNCYLSSKEGICSSALSRVTKRDQCCCSVGKAWGDDCEVCPHRGTAEYIELCDERTTPEETFNECSAWPELCNNGLCRKLPTGFVCECSQGFYVNSRGTNCTDINECQLNPQTCGPGECVNTAGSFECNCKEGYESHVMMKVCMDIDECAKDVMLCFGGSCVNTEGSFECVCPEGHELMPGGKACKDIDECSTGNAICSNGRCENFMGGYQCTCDRGFKPNDIHSACLDIDECALHSNNCQSGCVNTVGSFYCTCQNGFKLSPDGFSCVDINECFSNPDICGGGSCENEEGGYRCICVGGFELSSDKVTCSDVDECFVNPSICGVGDCLNNIGSYTCDCDPGFSEKPGNQGCTDDDECQGENICHGDANCDNREGSYICRCKAGFSGDGVTCRDVNECLLNNGGCDPNASCVNSPGSYICTCDDGFTGNGQECYDFDECENNLELCKNGQCLNDAGSFHCECDMGFSPTSDRQACEDINECDEFKELCMNGKCENMYGMFQCICNQGYELGELRSTCIDIDECLSEDSCNYGKCININGSYICNCADGFELLASGNDCYDRRLGSCYMDAGEGACYSSYPNRVQRAACCCSVGAGWGQNPGSCEPCPMKGTMQYDELCPGDGRVPTDKGGGLNLVDLDECELFPTLCKGGTCRNTYGSFQCTCPSGYSIDEMHICQDINECEVYPGICGLGTCINTVGDYTCDCPDGHLLMPDKNCMDMRKSTCFTRVSNTSTSEVCENPVAMQLARKLCCCSVGQGWLNPNALNEGQSCERCPAAQTDEYKELCGLKPGYLFDKDIDECSVIPNLCLNGKCVNTEGSYICDCNEGYQYDSKLLLCVDQDECRYAPCHETAICQNYPGSYSCTCSEGFQMSSIDFSCSDIDECQTLTLCEHGVCVNTDGGYQCRCDDGFTLSTSRKKCLDMNECDLQSDMCGRGVCTNMMGSYKCDCDVGFSVGSNGKCQDINECQTLQGICSYGRCINTNGNFTCECQNGYKLSEDGYNCIDINECTEDIYTCPDGRCVNYDGYYECLCFSGFKLSPSRTMCLDINECLEVEGACKNGRCINELGSYYCVCPQHFTQVFEGTTLKCIDTRTGLCFNDIINGECSEEMPVDISKAECCCALDLPAGWSYRGACETCPQFNSSDFQALCSMGIGYVELPDGSILDINECLMYPDACENGHCINMDGRYRCECNTGYELDGTSSYCRDVDECTSHPDVCGQGLCRNTIGSYMCSCYDGFQLDYNGKCEDINECSNHELHGCAFRCHNLPGTYVCVCPAGYELATNGRHCVDIDECLTATNNCRYACKNLVGSFICICPEGYQKVSHFGDDCEDVDECSMDANICQNGQCKNFEGGYRCECPPDLTLSAAGLSCVDAREDICHYELNHRGLCATNITNAHASTMALCCCSRAVAWGRHCTLCPAIGTAEHRKLCTFGPGFDVNGIDINECMVMPNACPNGQCLNTMGSYRCVCHEGYKVGESGKECIDMDECRLNPRLCDYKCVNTLGSFKCECDEGYTLSYDGRSCLDVDECSLGIHRCNYNSSCVNTDGGYKCQCPQGYQARNMQCVDINECSKRGVCGAAECINTDGAYYCSCAHRAGIFNPVTLQCENDQTSGTGGKGSPTNATTGSESSCKDEDCLFSCQQFASSYYCGCPLGYQLVDKGHCIATISPPDEKYFDNRLPLPHVPGRQGNNLPLGEGCWLCGISSVEKAQLVEVVGSYSQGNYYRSKRDTIDDISTIESMLLEPITINMDTSMTKLKSRKNVATLVASRKYSPTETYKLFGNENHKFHLVVSDKEISLQFRHKVVKQRLYKLILMIANESDFVLLPIEIHVSP